MLVAILLAAGLSSRAGEDKVLADLSGRPVLRWSADRFAAEPRVDRLVIVFRSTALERARAALVGTAKAHEVVEGGARRADSVRAGLRACADADAVIVHDAARPFIDPDTIARVLDAMQRHGAAAAGLPVADTLRQAAGDLAGPLVERDGVWQMQTPQAYARRDLSRAYARAEAPSDCAAAAAAAGLKVRLVRGHPLNFKITSAEDLAAARALAERGLVRP